MVLVSRSRQKLRKYIDVITLFEMANLCRMQPLIQEDCGQTTASLICIFITELKNSRICTLTHSQDLHANCDIKHLKYQKISYINRAHLSPFYLHSRPQCQGLPCNRLLQPSAPGPSTSLLELPTSRRLRSQVGNS